MAQPLLAVAINHYVADTFTHESFKLVAQRAIVMRTLMHFLACKFRSFAKRDDPRNVFGARASFALLMSADVLPVQAHATTNVKRAGAFWRIEFVTRHR